MAVITVSRKLGSRGDDIAEQVAHVLGYHYVDKAFIEAVLSQYGLVEFGAEYDSIPSFWEKFDAQKEERREMMVSMLNRVMRAVACHGNVVILGRSGFFLFEGYTDVLNVRIQAPLAFRIEQVMQREQVTRDEAEAIVKHGDEVRATFVKSFYNIQWDACTTFDLLIDTSKIPPDMAINWLVDAARALETKGHDREPSTAAIQVDPILAAAVSKALKCNVIHR
ncbi:MAG TPA: cytidylate kinase-like family protein [Anaerolineae bacterium]|nr:cytidylate kinase-like family protein [Anaerolineae bacterium]HQI87220.1 cytidylate kinase-like family protein [Anaerolineae bacterium]